MNTVVEEQAARPQSTNGDRAYVAPAVNIAEGADGYTLEAEMPGVNKDGLTIDLEGHMLTLEGRRQPRENGGTLLYRESDPADYRRVFELDPAIDGSKIAAHIEQGLLTVHLPKAEKVKPRKISVS